MALSYEKTPQPWRFDARALVLGKEPKKNEPWASPASASDLLELRAMLRQAASLRHGRLERLVQHRLPQELSKIDHLLAVHVCGYEYRPEGLGRSASDWDTNCAWRTGFGAFCAHAPEPWTTKTDLACNLAFRYVPRLRLDLRLGGARHGQLRKAKFDESHPTLPESDIPLPQEWPHGVARYPAIAVIDVFLTAFAMQKDAAVHDAPGTAEPAGIVHIRTEA
jgi:hypothetical protein